jgi:hypothetical protein
MPDLVLVVEGVVKEYGDEVKTRALDGVDLTLQRGELTELMGRRARARARSSTSSDCSIDRRPGASSSPARTRTG